MRIHYFLLLVLFIIACTGCSQRYDIAQIYTGPCWMDPDTTGP